MTDDRPRGEWFPTPWVLRLLGKPAKMRWVYAYGAVGGGVDGWEFGGDE